MPLEWDKDELERALRHYDPKGYPVQVPILGEGKIEYQLLGTTGALYKVKAKKPIEFDEYARRIQADTTPLTRAQIEEMWAGRTVPFTDEFIEKQPSRKDIEFLKIRDTGCMGPDETVTCIVAPWAQTSIFKLKRGMLVEYAEQTAGGGGWQGTGGARVWAGRIVGIRKQVQVEGRPADVALLELFEPVSYYRTPELIANEEIKPGFYSEFSWAWAYGLKEAFELAEMEDKIPKGKLTEDKKELLLDDPFPVKKVKEFCDEFYSEDPHCFLHALTMFILPIEIGGGGEWHPLRQDRTDDYMASIQVDYE